MIDVLTAIELALVVIVGIPFIIAFVIPMFVYFLGGRTRFVPKFEDLMRYFNVDMSQPPYSEWFERSPVLFFSMTAIELYISYYLIYLIRGIKMLFKGIYWLGNNTLGRYMRWQWKRWDKEFEKKENDNK